MSIGNTDNKEGENKTLIYLQKYVKEYIRQTMEDNCTNCFDDLPDTEKASVAALGLMLHSVEEYCKGV